MYGYLDTIDKMVWSYSRLSAFEHCKYEFYLNYIIPDNEIYLSESNFYAQLGSFVHEILAMIFSGKLKPSDALNYYRDNFDSKITYKVKQSIMESSYLACAEYLSDENFDWLKDYEILGAEIKVKFRIKNYNFIGFIDLLLRDKRDGRLVIVDNKSSKYPFKADGTVKAKERRSFECYKKQMYLYAYAVSNVLCKYTQPQIDKLLDDAGHLHGSKRRKAQKALHKINDITKAYAIKNFELPKVLMWNHFKDGGRLASIPFDKKEFWAALDWAIDTIHKIEKEEIYLPSLDGFYCSNLCNFRRSCEYVQNKRAESGGDCK